MILGEYQCMTFGRSMSWVRGRFYVRSVSHSKRSDFRSVLGISTSGARRSSTRFNKRPAVNWSTTDYFWQSWSGHGEDR